MRGKGIKPRKKRGERRSQSLSLYHETRMEIILLQTTETCLLLWECGAKKEERYDKAGEVNAVGATNPGTFHWMGCLTEVSFCGKNQRLEWVGLFCRSKPILKCD